MDKQLEHINTLNFLRRNWLNIMVPVGFSSLSFVLYFAINFLMTQILTPATYGDAFLAWTWILITGSCVMLGVDQSSRVFICTFLNKGDDTTVQQYIQWGMGFIRKSLILCAFLAIFSFIIFDPMNFHKFNYFNFHHSHWASFYAFICVLTPLAGFTNWMASLLICYKQTSQSTFLQFAGINIIMIPILLITYFFITLPISPLNIRFIMFLTFLIVTIMAYTMCIRGIPNFNRLIFSKPKKASSKKLSSWQQECYSQAFNMLIFNVIANLDFILMGFYAKGSDAVGFYNIALTIINLVVLVPFSVFQYLTADIKVALEQKNKTQALQNFWNKTMTMNALITILVSLLTYAYLDQILNIFGAEYMGAKPYTIILLVGQCISSLLGAPFFVLQYAGHVKKFVIINIMGIIILTVFSYILVMKIGLIGVAYASITASIFQSAASAVCVKKYTNLKPMAWI